MSAPPIEYPRIVEYAEALQHPGKCFCLPELQAGLPEPDARGCPLPRTGGNAAVFKLQRDGGSVAVKVFRSFSARREQRYQTVSDYLNRARCRCLVDFTYIQEGIRAPRSGETYRDAAWYPVLRMAWVAGVPLKDWIDERVSRGDGRALARLADRWADLVGELKRHRVAHGDLQHGNILVVEDDPVLVDYDGLCVPDLEGQEAAEAGLPGYQHPLRGQQPLSPALDDFSAWVVWIALRAAASDPHLWQRHVAAVENENVLFTAQDILDPDRSVLWRDLLSLRDTEAARRARELRDSLDQPFDRVPVFSLDRRALLDEDRKVQEVLDWLTDEERGDLPNVDLACAARRPEVFVRHRERLRAHLQREMDRVSLRLQGEPELLGEGPARMVVLRWTGWTWRTMGLGEQTCKLAVSTEGYFDHPADARCSQVRHRGYSADRGVKRAVPAGVDRLFVTVWPVLRLDALDVEAVGPPLHVPVVVAPPAPPEGGLQQLLKKVFTA